MSPGAELYLVHFLVKTFDLELPDIAIYFIFHLLWTELQFKGKSN